MNKRIFKEPNVRLLPQTMAHRFMYNFSEQGKLALESSYFPTAERKAEIVKRINELRIERDAIADLTANAKKLVEVPHTITNYCQSCRRDLKPLELIHYIVWDNNLVCTTCSATPDLLDAEKEPRVYVPDTEDYNYYRNDC